MTKSFTRKYFVGLTLGCLASVAIADTPPVQLTIDAPNSNGGLALLTESGWPLTIKMVVNLDDTLGWAIDKNYTNKGRFGFLVLEDPDGCPWMDDDDWRYSNGGLAPEGCPFPLASEDGGLASDEIYIEFRPDVDEAGMPDSSGDADEQAELVDSAGGTGPEFGGDGNVCVPGTDDSDCQKMGPNTGGEVVDGYGIGSDDDMVGLFLYTKMGIGLVFDEPEFELSYPLGVHNLAGLINSVTYDLSDLTKTNSKAIGQKGKPTEVIVEEARFWAHINMPKQVVRNIIQYDACTGDILYTDPPANTSWSDCSGDDAWRIDGGPVETPPEKFRRADAASIYLLNNTMFTVHAFLVSGHAPDQLFDANGDGDYRDDAELAGYTVLSNLDSISLLQVSDVLCWGGGGNAMYKDLDANGEATVPIVCGPGPGGLSRPPR